MESPSLANNPRLSTWLDFSQPGEVHLHMGKSELGQGIDTAVAQILADIMGVAVDQVIVHAPDTVGGPDENFTAGSLSIPHSGSAIASAAAHARALFRDRASEVLGSADIEPVDGVFSANGTALSYWDLSPEVDLSVDVDVDVPLPPGAGTIGASTPRVDLRGKVHGEVSYLHDMRLPGMVFGRTIRPAFRGANLASVDEEAVRMQPGVLTTVRDGNFLGVIAGTEIDVLRAQTALTVSATWDGNPHPWSDAGVSEFLMTVATDDVVLAEANVNDAATFTAQYSRPFLAHASIGTACAVAVWSEDMGRLEVWSHTQGVYPLRNDLARAFDCPPDAVHVHHVQGAGCYGHNPADDVAFDAAQLARAVPGLPVHVTWSREDELGWGPFGPAMVVRISSTTDESGLITDWSWDGYGNGHSSRPNTLPTPSLLGYSELTRSPAIPASEDPPPAAGAGIGRNAIPGYDIPAIRAVAHRALEMPVRASALRSLGAHMNVFAIESHIDDLARQFDMDPVEYRLRHLSEPRARAVVESAATAADWGSSIPTDRGRGIGFARYKGLGAWCAVVADVEAVEEVRVTGLWIAVDCGRVINPDGVENQIEGGAIQAMSWTLRERVRFDAGAVSSNTWEDYPIVRFVDTPPVHVFLIDQPREKWLGAGEASMGPTAAALGNAITNALGIRVRDLPITADAIVAAMDD